MEVAILITNREKYTQKVEKVELDKLTAESADIFTGAVHVTTKRGTIVPFYGLIEAKDFEGRFGFVLTTERVSTFSF